MNDVPQSDYSCLNTKTNCLGTNYEFTLDKVIKDNKWLMLSKTY